MYSRKYIRTAMARTDGRAVLPPDYTGTAFSQAEVSHGAHPGIRPEDYPEAVILPREVAEEAVAADERLYGPPAAEDAPLWEEGPLPEEPLAPALFRQAPQDLPAERMEASPAAAEEPPLATAEPADSADDPPALATPAAEAEAPAGNAELPAEDAPPFPLQTAKEEPLLSAEFLRSLTLEDLMLGWMLLLLLTCREEEQIYLLLGLLLISR